MLPEYMKPIPGDDTGNNMKWDNLVLDAERYVRTGNYALLSDTRYNMGRFVELDSRSKVAIPYYCMVFYSNLNGFDSSDRADDAMKTGFASWHPSSHVDSGLINKIFDLCKKNNISDAELTEICKKAFVPAAYKCHIFSITECIDILFLARDSRIDEIEKKIESAGKRFVTQYNQAKQNVM